jgi:membrane-associated phospholipid phosphatase
LLYAQVLKNKSLTSVLQENLAFLLPYAFFLVAAGIWMCIRTKTEIHLYINTATHGLADTAFRGITLLGDGISVAIIALLFLICRVRNGMLIAVSGIIAGLSTQLLKRTVFSSMERPRKFFEGIHDLYLVPGVENYSGHSFPSGHTAAAFALYLSIALLTPNKILKCLLFFLALLVGFSRVYLSQHFLQDIYAGSLLGTLSVLLTFLMLSRMAFFRDATWMDHSFLGNRR